MFQYFHNIFKGSEYQKIQQNGKKRRALLQLSKMKGKAAGSFYLL